MVSVNRALRRIFGPRRDEVTGEWRKLHNELNDLYSHTIDQVIKWRRMRWAEHVARMGEINSACMILVGRPEGRRPCVRPRSIWEYNIKVYLQEVGWGKWNVLIWLRIGTVGGIL